MDPVLSIIVPVYNVETYLHRCIDSLRNQTLQDIEIILVDDKSPDNCPNLCDLEAMQDARIKVVHKQVNEGLGFARNTGLEYSVGKYVTFCDSDDYIEESAYEFVYKKMEEQGLDICWFQPQRVFPDGTLAVKALDVDEEYFFGKKQIKELQLDVIGRNPEIPTSKNRGFSSCMALFKRDLYVKSGIRYPSERVVASEDFLFIVRFLPYANSVGILPNVFYNYTINPDSISQSFSDAKLTRLLNLLYELQLYCQETFKFEDYKNHYYSQVIRIFKVILKYTVKSNYSFIQIVNRIREACVHPLIQEVLKDPVIQKYGLRDRIYLFCIKYKIVLFFIFIYKYK